MRVDGTTGQEGRADDNASRLSQASSDAFDDTHTQDGSIDFSFSRIMSVTSLLAMKRDRIERQRKESVGSAHRFSVDAHNDKKVDSKRTLTMIHTRMRKEIKPGPNLADLAFQSGSQQKLTA